MNTENKIKTLLCPLFFIYGFLYSSEVWDDFAKVLNIVTIHEQYEQIEKEQEENEPELQEETQQDITENIESQKKEYTLKHIQVPTRFVGKTKKELMSVIKAEVKLLGTVKKIGDYKISPIDPSYTFKSTDILVFIGTNDQLERIVLS